jgi:hypothetical protein
MFLLFTLLTPTFVYIIFCNNSPNDSNKLKKVDQIFINQIEIQISQNIYIKNVIELYSDSFNDMNELKIVVLQDFNVYFIASFHI